MTNDNLQNEEILIEFYQGSLGHTVIIICKNIAHLERLQEIFKALSQGNEKSFQIEKELHNVKLVNLYSLCLEVKAEIQGFSDNKVVMKREGKNITFSWSRSSEGWSSSVGLIERLIVSDKPNHTFLADDDFLIEINYKEH